MSGSESRADAGIDLAGISPALLWSAGPEGITFNASWLAFTGLRPEQAAGDGWEQAVHPDDLARRRAVAGEAAERHQPFEAEYRLRRRDGAWRWVLDRGVPLPGSNGTYAGACFDITERRVEELELLASRENLRLALAAGNMGTWVWDRRSGSVIRDRNLQALYGLDLEPGHSSFDEWVKLVHPDDRDRLLGEVDRALAEGGTYELEHRVVRPDGEVRWLSRRGSAYFDDDGEVLGTRGLVVDITDRKRAEEERYRLLLAEQQARRDAEQVAGRLGRLQAVTAGLADARTVVEVADVIMTQVSEALEADTGVLCLLNEAGDRLEVIRYVGYDPARIQPFQSFSYDAPLPVTDALRTGQMVILRSIAERDERYPNLRGISTDSRAFAVVPLLVGDTRFGAIALGWHDQHGIDELDRGFLTSLGQQAAQALDRATFYEAEQTRALRQGFLADASRLLGSSLDYEWTLSEVAKLAVPLVADACSFHLLVDGELRMVAAAGVADGTDKGDWTDPWCFPTSVLLDMSGRWNPLLVATVTEDQRRSWATDEAHLATLERLGVCSAVAVPLHSPTEALGVMVLASGSSDRHFGPADESFVEDLADRAAGAIANCRLSRARGAIAHTLQQSLLPPEVPILPGLEVAARYLPVGADVEVGGDFFDVFAAGAARWGVVIGDVSGKGIPAASLTALARYTVRTASRGDAAPSGVLEVLNNSIIDDGLGERFCTVALAFLRYDEGGVHFTVSCGGHPLPLLVDPGGGVRTVGQPGTAIGLFGQPRLTDVSTRLRPGEMLVFFTDGVVEARSPTGAFADGLVESTLRSCAARPAEMVAEAIEHALFDFAGGRPRDDLAILVVRRPEGMFHEHFLPGHRAVPRIRQRLREWLGANQSLTPELAGDVLLLANELCTNAEREARTGVDLHVSVGRDNVTVDVSDDGAGFGGRTPPIAPPPADAVVGRGMHIVSRLAEECIVRSTSSGTLLRCILARTAR